MVVKIRYGAGNSLEKEFPEGTTVGKIVTHPSVRAALGYGENVRALIERVPQDLAAPVRSGDVIDIESAANAKAN